MEQEIIEKSVRLDVDGRKVRVNLPFNKDPTEDLTKRHKGNSSRTQAVQVYRTQCKKSDIVNQKGAQRIGGERIHVQIGGYFSGKTENNLRGPLSPFLFLESSV